MDSGTGTHRGTRRNRSGPLTRRHCSCFSFCCSFGKGKQTQMRKGNTHTHTYKVRVALSRRKLWSRTWHNAAAARGRSNRPWERERERGRRSLPLQLTVTANCQNIYSSLSSNHCRIMSHNSPAPASTADLPPDLWPAAGRTSSLSQFSFSFCFEFLHLDLINAVCGHFKALPPPPCPPSFAPPAGHFKSRAIKLMSLNNVAPIIKPSNPSSFSFYCIFVLINLNYTEKIPYLCEQQEKQQKTQVWKPP